MGSLFFTASNILPTSPKPSYPVNHNNKWKSLNTSRSSLPRDLAPSNAFFKSRRVAPSNALFSIGNVHENGPSWSAMRIGNKNQSVSTWLWSLRSTIAAFSRSGMSGFTMRRLPLGWSGSRLSQFLLYNSTHCLLHWKAWAMHSEDDNCEATDA